MLGNGLDIGLYFTGIRRFPRAPERNKYSKKVGLLSGTMQKNTATITKERENDFGFEIESKV